MSALKLGDGIGRRSLATVFVGVTLALLGGGFWFYRTQENEIRHNAYEEIASIAKLKVTQILQWKRERLIDVVREAQSPLFIEAMGKIVGKEKDAGGDSQSDSQFPLSTTELRERMLGTLEAARRVGTYPQAVVVSTSGQVVFSTGTDHGELSAATRCAVDVCIASPGGVLSDFYRSPDGEVGIDFLAAIRDGGGHALGAVILHCNADDYLHPYLQAWPTPSRTAETLLVGREGNEVVFLNELRHSAKTALSMRFPLTRTELPAVQAVLGRRGIWQGKDYRNKDVLAYLCAVPETPWFMVAKVDRDEILAEARERAATTCVIVGALILLSALATAFAYTRRKARLFKDLLEAEGRQRESEREYRLLFEGMLEGFVLYEVICDDSGQPVDFRYLTVNPAFERLTGLSAGEVIGRTMRGVLARTEKSWFEPYLRVAISGEPIQREDYNPVLKGHFTVSAFRPKPGQLAMVFEEISERKSAEARVARLTQLYAAQSQCNQAVVRSASREELLPEICRNVAQIGGVGLVWIGLLDSATGTIRPAAAFGAGIDYLEGLQVSVDADDPLGRGPTGVSVRENLPFWCEDFQNDPNTAPWHERAKRFGWVAVASLPLCLGGKPIGALLIYSDKPQAFDEEVRALLMRMANDIGFGLERFANEAETTKLQLLARHARDPLLLMTLDGKISECNRAAEQLYGCSRAELVQLGIEELRVGETPEAVKFQMLKARSEGILFEAVHRRKNGATVPVEVSSTGVVIEGQEMLLSVIRDITGRQRDEELLRDAEKQAREKGTLLKSIMESPQGMIIFALDREYCYLEFTLSHQQTIQAIWGVEIQIGMNMLEVITDPADRAKAKQNFDRVLQGERLLMEEEYGQNSLYRSVYENRYNPIVELDGKVSGLTVFVIDITERRQTEARLRLQGAALEAAANAIVITNNKGIIEWANPAFTTITGYSAAEAVGKNPRLLKSGQHDRAFYQDLWKTIGAGNVWRGELINRRKDGSLYPEEMIVTPIKEAVGGAITHFIAVKQDISERKWVEAELQNSEAFSLSIRDSLIEHLAVLNDQGVIIAVNRAWQRFAEQNSPPGCIVDSLGTNYLTICEQTPKGIPDENDAAKARKGIQEVIDGSRMEFILEYPCHAVDQQRWFQMLVTPLRGSQKGVVMAHLDITERKHAQELLAKSNENLELRVIERTAELKSEITERKQVEQVLAQNAERLSLAARAGGVGIWDYDIANNTLTWDAQMFVLYGIARESFGGAYEAWKSGLHPDDVKQAEKDGEMAGTGEKEYDTEFRVVWPDGTVRDIRALAIVQRDDSGNPIRMIGTNWDITERNRIDQELRKAKEAAEEANRAKSTFLANMSHEIRTPMNAILGFSQLMLHDANLAAQQRKHLETISHSGEHLLALINDILDMSKIEAGRVELSPSTFDLHAMLDDLEAMFRVRTDAKRLRLEVLKGGETPKFFVTDKNKLFQVLINLLGNAVKFTSQGSVVLRVSGDDAVPRRLLFEVEDTGRGIRNEAIGELFRPFVQVHDQEHSGAGAGSGLGLAISLELARLMGGEINVSSEFGKGSVFRFSIPMREGSADASGPFGQAQVPGLVAGEEVSGQRSFTAINPAQQPCRVLIVDDIENNRMLLFEMLKLAGFELRQAGCGEEAIRIFHSWRPHLILMDMRMPLMDGAEAIRRIRAAEGGEEVKIVSVTASVFEDTRRESLDAGADDFLGKPFKESDLFEKIGLMLGVGHYHQEKDPVKDSPATGGSPSAEDLAPLPEQLVGQIQKVAIVADYDLLLDLIQQVAAHNPPLSQELRLLAECFNYRKISDLLTQ